jgi:acetolactate synthase I/II/III large subunit
VATDTETQLHGGRLIARRLRAYGVTKLFTLSGGHLFSIYDGCRAEGIDIVDVRHEQTAAFAAEGWAKVTRELGVCALTAGPGVTNGMSAIASSSQNNSPILVLGGRAPQFRWGQGSLQEIDHVPFVRPLVKLASTPADTTEITGLVDIAAAAALTPHTGPTFVDFPLDQVFMKASETEPVSLPEPWRGPAADSAEIDRAVTLLAEAERPVIMAGTGLYWGRGEEALRSLAEARRIPVFLNGLARGCVPADHELFFSRARSAGLGQADVALVIGVPLDFRLGFGGAFAADADVIVIDAAEPAREHPRSVSVELYGALPATLEALRDRTVARGGGEAVPSRWVDTLGSVEREKRESEAASFADPRAPLHPMRIYGELATVLDRDAIVIGDGGDFVSFAGRVVDSFEPGCWLDPGPFGCLGSGPGYALAAKLARPDRQVVLLLGDGAFGFAGMEFDTLARHRVPVVAVMGNNGIWALEKHPMEALYGYSVAADLRPETRYDEMVAALGCHGELVRSPAELRPALERAFASGKPALVNVLTDPNVAYPRRSNLA